MPESRNAKSRASSYRKAFGSMANYSTAGSRGLGCGYKYDFQNLWCTLVQFCNTPSERSSSEN